MTWKAQSLESREQFYIQFVKNQVILIGIDLKRSSSRCAQGHNFIIKMIFNFSNKKGLNCTLKLCNEKERSPCSLKS